MDENLSLPGLTGMVTCDHSGNIDTHTGDEAEMFGTVVPYLPYQASLIGESFGLEGIEEVTLMGKNVSCVIVPKEEQVHGFIFDSKAKIKDILQQVL
ncbi:MAG: hypothetical protein ACPGN3_02920 [Opitutales bacterium]